MIITGPYVTADKVALFHRNLLHKTGEFTPESAVPDTTITQYITWVCSSLDLKFAEAGYVLPLQSLDAETWPTSQTTYLELVTAIGVSTMMSPGLKPAPGYGPGRTGSGENIFFQMYQTELQRIYDGRRTALRFRAAYYIGTPAELALMEPVAAKSDYSVYKMDKTKLMGLYDYTDLYYCLFNYARNYNVDWSEALGVFGLDYYN